MPELTYNEAVLDRLSIACPHCDLLQRLPNLASAASARCPRCNRELWRRREDALNRTLALAVTATVLLVVANTVPMLGLTVVGREASTTVIGGAENLWQAGQVTVAILVLFTAVIAPVLQVSLMLTIVLAAHHDPIPRWVGSLLRHYKTAQTWSMIEVMMLGVLVALVKIADYATVIPGTALFVLGALIVVLAAMQASFEHGKVWNRIQWALPGNTGVSAEPEGPPIALSDENGLTAMQRRLQRCETCGLLSRPAAGEEDGRCPRCGDTVEFRKRASIEHAWACLIAAAICYVPANVLPVLSTTTAGGRVIRPTLDLGCGKLDGGSICPMMVLIRPRSLSRGRCPGGARESLWYGSFRSSQRW